MKKILSMLICAAMLVGTFAVTSFAVDNTIDKALLFDDLTIGSDKTGSSGYAVNTQEYTHSDAGFTMIFDFLPLSGVSCTHSFDQPTYKHLSHFTFYTGDADGNKIMGYNFETQSYVIAQQFGWPSSGADTTEGSDKQSYFVGDSVEMPIVNGEWHRIAFRIEDVYLEVYIDGELTLEMEYKQVSHSYAMFWSQHCRYLMDNLVIANNNYDIEADDFAAELAAGNILDYATFDNVDTLVVEEGDDMSNTANFGFGHESGSFSLVDKAEYAGTLTDSAEEGALSFTDITGKAGKTVSTDLTYNSYAFEATKLRLLSDKLLTFNSVEDVADGCTVTCENGYVDISITDAFKGGKVATFKFDVAAEGPAQNDKYRFGLKFVEGVSQTNANMLTLDAGTLTVINFILGDVNEDGKVNLKDVSTIIKYRALWNPDPFNFEAADIYKDGNVNARDTNYLIRHLANWKGYEL